MRAARTLGFLAGITALALAALTVAAPAAAATLPAGQKISVFDQREFDFDSQQYNASPSDATSIAVGTPVTGYYNVPAIDVNDDGVGYALSTVDPGEGFDYPVLLKADANTGALTDALPVFYDGPFEATITECTGIDLQADGQILAACNDVTDGFQQAFVGVINPVTGAFTSFFDTDAELRAIAYDAVTGALWMFWNSGALAYAAIIDPDGSGSSLPIEVGNGVRISGADFDRGGQLWVTTSIQSGEIPLSALATLALVDGSTPAIVGPFVADGTALISVAAITVWGKLAATGSATGAEVLPVALGSALLLLAGAAFIATARLQRRRA